MSLWRDDIHPATFFIGFFIHPIEGKWQTSVEYLRIAYLRDVWMYLLRLRAEEGCKLPNGHQAGVEHVTICA